MTDFGFDVVIDWLTKHSEEITTEARRWNMTPAEFVVEMLSDALDAYKNIKLIEPEKV